MPRRALHRILSLIACATLCANLCAFGLPIAKGDDSNVMFETDVRPVLVRRCGKCHSENIQKGALNLASIGGIRRGGESGEHIVGAKADDSYLWQMIESGEMPPEGQPPLSADEKRLIRRWLEEGAHALQSPEDERLTQHDVIPIVLLRCATCHGARMKKGGVDMRTPASMKEGGVNGPALIPGDPNNSRMIQRIESEACPPRELLLKYFVKRPPATEVKVLRQWITEGAREFEIQPDVATTDPDPLVTDEDRQHWAFRPPQVTSEFRSIDEFIGRKLVSAGLRFSAEADRNTLVRRAYIDLIGLPPSVDEWKKWSCATDSNWYEEMIDVLLESPRYGERWGQYWLDVAGYADSEGGVSADPIRQAAWKYRDYVIRSFNDDKPYDRFLTEQIAGDELVDFANAPTITESMIDNLTATGFLRMGIDQTGSRTMNFVPERIGVIDDAIKVVSSGVMGLTMGCAKCHSHKYDPIPHRDYYRFKAIFQGAYDEHDWLTFKNRYLSVGTKSQRQAVAKHNPQLAKQLKQLESERKKAATAVQIELLRQHYPRQAEADRNETIRALRIADNNRTQPQRILVEMLQKVEVLPDARQPPSVILALAKVDELTTQVSRTRRRMLPTTKIRALWDRGEPSPTYVLHRGEHNKPGTLVGPGVPTVLTDGRTAFQVETPFPDGTPRTGRRLAFAKWLTAAETPLTARVMVNRIWKHHFGAGLVTSLDNFGVQSEPPTHPELLDWLAVEFVRCGWSIKAMHRLLMNSQTYRQTSRVATQQFAKDPQNRLLSRMALRRMDAETLRDALLFVADKLDTNGGGFPDDVIVSRDGQVNVRPTEDGNWRRSIYLQHRRTEIPSLLSAFDYPEMGPNCISRTTSTVSPQSLMLMNNEHVRSLAEAFANRISGEATSETLVAAVYQHALSRPPGKEESDLGVDALRRLTELRKGDRLAAVTTYCHTILNSAAFIYVD